MAARSRDAPLIRETVARPRQFVGLRRERAGSPPAADLLVQPRDSALTRITDPLRVQLASRVVLCVVAVCAHALLEGDDIAPAFVLVPVHKWIDGSKRPRGCGRCADVLRRLRMRPVCLQSTARNITPYWK